jgi:hypothetical protein
MSTCGWCKEKGLSIVRGSEVDSDTGDIVKTADRVLQPHKVRGSISTACKGPESYRSQDESGKPGRARAS